MNTTGRIRLKKTNQRINSELFGIILFVLSTAFALYLSFNLNQVPGIAQESKGISFLFVIYYIVFIVIFTAAALYIIKRHAQVMKAIFISFSSSAVMSGFAISESMEVIDFMKPIPSGVGRSGFPVAKFLSASFCIMSCLVLFVPRFSDSMSFKSDATSYLFGGSVYFSSISHFLPFTVSPTKAYMNL